MSSIQTFCWCGARFGLDGGVDKGDSGDDGSSGVFWASVGGICGVAGLSSLFLVSFRLL